jgi:hypothetical protein
VLFCFRILQYRTALHWAVFNASINIVSTLCEFGANVDVLTFDDTTPLMLACQQGSRPIIEVLVRYGASTRLLNKEGKSAMQMAEEIGCADIPDMIEALSSEVNDNLYKSEQRQRQQIGNMKVEIAALKMRIEELERYRDEMDRKENITDIEAEENMLKVVYPMHALTFIELAYALKCDEEEASNMKAYKEFFPALRQVLNNINETYFS